MIKVFWLAVFTMSLLQAAKADCALNGSATLIPLDRAWLKESYQANKDSRQGARGVISIRFPDRSLQLALAFSTADPNRKQGEVFRYLDDVIPGCRLVNLAGARVSITFRVPGPLAMRGRQGVAGAQVAIESESVDGIAGSQYGEWEDLRHPGDVQTITITPTELRKLGWKDVVYDVTRSSKLIFKIGLNSGFRGALNTTLDILEVRIDWPTQKQRVAVEAKERASRCKVSDNVTLQRLPSLPVRSPGLVSLPVSDVLAPKSATVESVRVRPQPSKPQGQDIWEITLRFPVYKDDSDGRTASVVYPLERLTDFTNKKAVAWVALGPALRGVMSRPNRVWLDLYDDEGRVLGGSSINASLLGMRFSEDGCDHASQWMRIEVAPTFGRPIAMGGMDPMFRADRVKAVGFRFLIGKFSHLLHKDHYPLTGKLLLSGLCIEQVEEFPAEAASSSTNRTPSETKPFPLAEFCVGVNYPWLGYCDVGIYPYGGRDQSGFYSSRHRLHRDFAILCKKGVQVARVFLLGDARTGLIHRDGKVVGLDRYALRDIDALVETAAQTGIRLIPVLVDFLVADGILDRQFGAKKWKEGEAPALLTEPSLRAAFIDNALQPIMKRLQEANLRYPGVIYAVDIANEIENATAIGPKFPEVKNFVRQVNEMARREAPGLRTTLGSRDRGDLADFWGDFDLDLLQFHYYPDHESLGRGLDYPAGNLGFKNPVLVGEVEPSNIEAKLDLLHARGYAGALFWSYRGDDGFVVDLDAIERWVRRQGRTPACRAIPPQNLQSTKEVPKKSHP